MNFYWVYDIPNWLFFVLTVAVFIFFALLGTFLFSVKFEKWLGLTREHNEIVGFFLSLSGVFYGITLGLIAVATFENFNSTEDKVDNESSALAALYRDVSILEQTEKSSMQATLKEYTQYIANEAWPFQRKGIVSKRGSTILDSFQKNSQSIHL